jgi:hypothetical protein
MFGKDFTDPHTLIALGITIIVSVVEGSNGGYIREILAITIYGFQWNRLCRQP